MPASLPSFSLRGQPASRLVADHAEDREPAGAPGVALHLSTVLRRRLRQPLMLLLLEAKTTNLTYE